ncbi:hypothetical protein EsH8_XIII_000012 [Colletotrichum jinshuiense]
MDKPCSRCLKAQVPCVLGLRGKVGRPATAKNMKRKAPSCEDSHHHIMPDHDGRPQEQAESLFVNRAPSPVAGWVGPDAEPPGTRSATMAALSGGGLEPGTEATTAHPCLQSPRLYPTPDISPFSFNFIDIDTREPSSTLPPDLGTPFPQNFGFSSFASRNVEKYFQEPFLATDRSPVDSDGDVLESGLNDAPTTPPFPCLGAWSVRDHDAQDSSALSNQYGSVSHTTSGGQQTPTPVSMSLPAGTRSSHERLCRISLQISEAAAGFAKDSALASVVALKGVVGLASELIETARQILVQQGQDDPSARSSTTENSDSSISASEMSSGEGGGGSPFASSASSVTVCEHASSNNCTRHTPGDALDPTLVFLLLACYAGFLSVLELVLERLWAQYGDHPSREDDKTGRGTKFLSTLLETSLAVHTVHCLFKLLRKALFPEDPRDRKNDPVSDSGIALLSGRGRPVVRGAGRGITRGLWESTCEDIRQREEDILKRTEELQQRLVR